MKFIFLIAFLVFPLQSACESLGEPCPSAERIEEIVSFVGGFGDELVVNYRGAYIKPEQWRTASFPNKEIATVSFMIYRDCHILERSTLSYSIKIFDYYSGKEIGKLSQGLFSASYSERQGW